MGFIFEKTTIPGVMIATPKVHGDDRGFFIESYKKSEFLDAGIVAEFKQDNHSKSKKGVLRGLHYQLSPSAQGKLVRVLKGAIIDVAVDIRKGSATYAKYVSVELSDHNRKMLWIPEGFAHGFYVLEDGTEIVYKTTEEYSPKDDAGIIWNDKEIGIKWPTKNPILSDKDSKLPSLKNAKNNFKLEVK